MNKLILISALLVATLSAVYASPYSSQERLLSLLENARQEQADEQEEIGAVARTAWWKPKPKPPPTKNCKSVRRGLEKEKDQLKVQICTYSTFVYDICSGYVEEVPEEPVTVQGHCKNYAGLRNTILEYKGINSALEMFVSDSQPSICAHLEAVQQLCGVPELMEGDEDQDY